MEQDHQVDLHLISEVRKGNKHAFDTLVLKYQYRVFKLIARYISDPNEALDITQETFIKAYNALDHFRGDSLFYTWLYRIAINASKNYLISRGRHMPAVMYELSEIEPFLSKANVKEYSTPERSLIYNELEHMLFEIIDDLPSDLRTSIMLRELEGLTYEEIAGIMSCPVGTVRSRIFRARAAIEKKVGPYIDKLQGQISNE